jgi:hypothetical protein
MMNEPSREPHTSSESAEKRRRRMEALLQGGATRVAGVALLALPAPKIPPMQGD